MKKGLLFWKKGFSLRVESKLLNNKSWLVKQYVQDDYDANSELREETVIVKGDCLALAKCRQYSTSGLVVLDAEMFFSADETDLFTIEGDCIVMDFMFSNNVKAEIEELEDLDYENPNTHNIWYTSNFTAKYEMPAYQKINYMAVILSKGFYQQLFTAGKSIHPDFASSIANRNASYLSPEYLPFSPAIQWIIQEMRDCQRTGIFKRIYFETKIRELLLLQHEMYLQRTEQPEHNTDQAEIKKLQQAKEILDAGFINPPSLIELSRKIALNEFKLKKGFKQRYGDTVRSYIIKLRLNHARKLLKSGQSSIGDIAYQCGYKDVSHFSAAFKSCYGCSPKQMF